MNGLTTAETGPGLRNPYSAAHAAHNLKTFLGSHDPAAWCLLLVGEAPGYRGAAVSGVPLASLSVLTEDWSDPWQAFGPCSGYREPSDGLPSFRREATATIVWEVLHEVLVDAPLPLTWNAVPFHPHGAREHSNRPLRRTDYATGLAWLERLLVIFPNVRPIAVGRAASNALQQLGVHHSAVRHPSRGGKLAFRAGLLELLLTADRSRTRGDSSPTAVAEATCHARTGSGVLAGFAASVPD